MCILKLYLTLLLLAVTAAVLSLPAAAYVFLNVEGGGPWMLSLKKIRNKNKKRNEGSKCPTCTTCNSSYHTTFKKMLIAVYFGAILPKSSIGSLNRIQIPRRVQNGKIRYGLDQRECQEFGGKKIVYLPLGIEPFKLSAYDKWFKPTWKVRNNIFSQKDRRERQASKQMKTRQIRSKTR